MRSVPVVMLNDDGESFRRDRQAKDDGDVEARAGFGMPGMSMPADARGLLIGDPTVNVLLLNIALDKLAGTTAGRSPFGCTPLLRARCSPRNWILGSAAVHRVSAG